MYYEHLANHLDNLDNHDNLLVKSDSSIEEVFTDNNDNSANMSSSSV